MAAGLVDGTALTPTGHSFAEEAGRAVETRGQVGREAARASARASGGLVILKGNLAPGGCVVKMAGHERRMHRGPARVFDGEEDAMACRHPARDQSGRRRRHPLRGPRGGRGMREMLGVAAALDDAVLRGRLARWRPPAPR